MAPFSTIDDGARLPFVAHEIRVIAIMMSTNPFINTSSGIISFSWSGIQGCKYYGVGTLMLRTKPICREFFKSKQDQEIIEEIEPTAKDDVVWEMWKE